MSGRAWLTTTTLPHSCVTVLTITVLYIFVPCVRVFWPDPGASAGRPKSKASRVLGRDGRTLHNIIEDAIVRIRALKNNRSHGDAVSFPASDRGQEFPHRQGLLSGKSFWTLELELPDFKVVAMSEGLKEWTTRQRSSAEGSTPAPISYLCEVAHPDDEFALRKTVADQKMVGTRIQLRLEQQAATSDLVGAGSKDRTAKKQAGKQAGKGKQDNRDETNYIKVDMLLAGITSGTQQLVLVGTQVLETAGVLQEVMAPAPLEQQQQRWQKREQRMQHRIQAQDLEQQHKKQLETEQEKYTYLPGDQGIKDAAKDSDELGISIEGGYSIEGRYSIKGRSSIEGRHSIGGRQSLEDRHSIGGRHSI